MCSFVDLCPGEAIDLHTPLCACQQLCKDMLLIVALRHLVWKEFSPQLTKSLGVTGTEFPCLGPCLNVQCVFNPET
jgi:hypothetical protein